MTDRHPAIIRDDRAELLRQLDEIEAAGEFWSAVLVVTEADTPPPIRQAAEGWGAAVLGTAGRCKACGRPFARTALHQEYCKLPDCQAERKRGNMAASRLRRKAEKAVQTDQTP